MNRLHYLLTLALLLGSLPLSAQWHPQWTRDFGVTRFSQNNGSNVTTYDAIPFYEMAVSPGGRVLLPVNMQTSEAQFGGSVYNAPTFYDYNSTGIPSSLAAPFPVEYYGASFSNAPDAGVAVNSRGFSAQFSTATRFIRPDGTRPYWSANFISSLRLPNGKNLQFNKFDTSVYLKQGFQIKDIAIDDDQNVYVAGNLRFTQSELITMTNDTFSLAAGMGTFIARIDTAGRMVWIKSFSQHLTASAYNSNSNSLREFLRMKCDRWGNIYILTSNWSSNWSQFYDGVEDTTTWAKTKNYRLIKINAATGEKIWIRGLPSFVSDFDISPAGDRLYFLGGYYRDPASTNLTQVTWGASTLSRTTYAAEYIGVSDSGAYPLKAVNLMTPAVSLSLNPSGNLVYIAGNFADTARFPGHQFGSRYGGYYVSWYDSSLSYQAHFVDTFYNRTFCSIRQVGIDSAGQVYALTQKGTLNLTDSFCNPADSSLRLIAYGPSPMVIQKPAIQASGFHISDISGTSMQLTWQRGNGQFCIIVARPDSALIHLPADSQSYTASAVYGSGSNLGNDHYVVYSGTGNSCWVSNLAPNRRYHFALMEFNGCMRRERYLLPPVVAKDSTRIASVYYNKPSGPIDSLGTWGMNPDGSGYAPTLFTMSNSTYWMVNNPAPQTKGGRVTFTGNNVRVMVGDSSRAVHLVVSDSSRMEHDRMHLSRGSQLTLDGVLMGVGPGSSFTSDSGTVLVLRRARGFSENATLYDLLAQKPGPVYIGNTTVGNKLELTSILEGILTLGYDSLRTGTLLMQGGAVQGSMNRWYKPGVSPDTLLFPFTHQRIGYRPAHLELSYSSRPFTADFIKASYNTIYGAHPAAPAAVSDSSGLFPVRLNAFNGSIGWTLNYPYAQLGSGAQMIMRVTEPSFHPGISKDKFRLGYYSASAAWKPAGISLGNHGSDSLPEVLLSNPFIKRGGSTQYRLLGDTVQVPLPVSWLALSASSVAGAHVQVDWATASEQNNSHFEIERSADGRTFSYVGEKPAEGNSQAVHTYTFTDENAFEESGSRLLYYRIRQVDDNGAFTYSKVLAVNLHTQAGLSMQVQAYPNPFTQALFILVNNADGGEVLLEVYDQNGYKYFSQLQGSSTGSIVFTPDAVNTWAAGLYLLRVRNGATLLQHKLLKIK